MDNKFSIKSLALTVFALCVLLSSCGTAQKTNSSSADITSEPQTADLTYADYERIPTLHPLGKITNADLSLPLSMPIHGKDTNFLFISNDGCWLYDQSDNNTVHRVSLSTGEHKVGKQYAFSIAVPRFTMTEGGAIWHCYDSGGDNLTLIAFDEATAEHEIERTWPQNHAFSKLQGYGSDIFINRAELPDSSTWHYVVEKYNTVTRQGEIIVETTFKTGDSKGEFFYAMSIDNDHLFLLVREQVGEVNNYVLRQYDLNGQLQKSYAIPEYTTAYTSGHSGAFDMEAFDGYIAIENLNGYCAVFQLTEDGEAKRIYFSENVDDTSALTTERPTIIPRIEDRAQCDRYTVFKYALGEQLIVYDRDTNRFSSIAISVSGLGRLYPIAINKNLDLLMQRQISENGKVTDREYYLVNLQKFLQ